MTIFGNLFNTKVIKNHNNLNGLQLANDTVTYGHIDDQQQTIYGNKRFNDNMNIASQLRIGSLSSPTRDLHLGNGSEDSDLVTSNFYLNNTGSTAFSLRNSAAAAEFYFGCYTSGVFGMFTAQSLEARTSNINRLYITSTGGLATGAETEPDVTTGGLCLQQNGEDGNIFSLKSLGDVDHGITSQAETDTFLQLLKENSTEGGLRFQSFSESTTALKLQVYSTTEDTTTATTSNGSIVLDSNLKSGTDGGPIGATGNSIIFSNNGSATHIFKGNGDTNSDGTFNSSAYDFAEYFESASGEKIPNGTSIVFEKGKIRPAEKGEKPQGVISTTACFVGNQKIYWPEKYLTDDFGKKIKDEEGNYLLNPKYDETKTYIPRENRKEWHIVGLIGQVYVRKECPVNPAWIFLKKANENANLYLIFPSK